MDNEKVSITLSKDQLNIIAMALGQLPYKTVAQLIGEIAKQVEDHKS